MKKLKKPTRWQRMLMRQRRLDPAMWLVERDTPEKMVLVHRLSDRTRKIIPKKVE